jgi:hypothetical protein
MTTRTLNPKERAQWAGKLNGEVRPSALVFADAGEDGSGPYMIRVTNGQWEQDPRQKTLVIQVFKRVDIHPDKAVTVLQHALVDVFGPHAGAEAECDYRNVAELKKVMGANNVISEPHDTMTVIFRPGAVTRTRRPAYVRDRLAHEIRKWHERSLSW